MGASDFTVTDADLDLLDAYLLSDQSPPECMMLSDLDGFLTGVAIGDAPHEALLLTPAPSSCRALNPRGLRAELRLPKPSGHAQ